MKHPCCLPEKIYAETAKTTSDIIFPTSDVVFSMSDVVLQTVILYNRDRALASAIVYYNAFPRYQYSTLLFTISSVFHGAGAPPRYLLNHSRCAL